MIFNFISGTVGGRQSRKRAGAFIELISCLRVKWRHLLILKRRASLHDNSVRPAFCGFHASFGPRLIRESRSPQAIKRPYNAERISREQYIAIHDSSYIWGVRKIRMYWILLLVQ